ncbi:MAG: biopolymer transporter ExbD [Bacteroidales bacterium]|nr:biopolymer transporter ExbD [Bacteroidales bacterium]MCF8343414.1 biopolymer transporter ExbD [Bacteroidales bacterium]MCF8349854.1 biopolymer transporter ExbD [Bacteroidales bacterium]MCF8375550.1 biopolymer transporter ExbD [Bacteroidales bacterium]MCF8399949.1 biopolymer transporter ExbD [Bacteroidales bacterium]
MAIQTRNKRSIQFSMAGMSDLVFLLLIFFMLTSTLIAPTIINLNLPESRSESRSRQTVTVYVLGDQRYFVEKESVNADMLYTSIARKLGATPSGSVVIRSNKDAQVQSIVNVIDAVNSINRDEGKKHKVVLATSPKN